MALQGTIDAFPLTDVMALLASSAKTGRLSLDGDRGSSSLWIREGAVVGSGSAADGANAALLVFGLLRFGDGSFVFEADEGAEFPEHAVEPVPLDTCVEDATELLEEWERIEAVVPSMRHRVRLVEELGEESVTVDGPTWTLIVALGDSPTVAQLAERLESDEFTCCSGIAGVVAKGLVEVTEPSPDSPAPADQVPIEEVERPVRDLDDVEGPVDLGSVDPVDEVSPPFDLSSSHAVEDRSAEQFPDHFPIDDLVGPDAAEADDPWSSPEMERLESQRFAAAQTFESVGLEPLPLGEPSEEPAAATAQRLHEDPTADAWDEMVAAQSDESGETADEVLRQMSRLSPQAAEAIAAALKTPGADAPGDPDGRQGEHSGQDEDGPISYLGSF